MNKNKTNSIKATKENRILSDDVSKLKSLGTSGTEYVDRVDANLLETFPNKYLEGKYVVQFETNEFTSLCPKTGQPDFAQIMIEYLPDKSCIESKSLKLYLFSYRSEGSFMESITNRIARDLIAICDPHVLVVWTKFAPRGGIAINVAVKYYRDKGFTITTSSKHDMDRK